MLQVEVGEGFCGRCLLPLPEGKTDYCSKACKKRAWRRRRTDKEPAVGQRPNEWCPHPTKAKYASETDAAFAMRYRFPRSNLFTVYLCRCDWWHIGHKVEA